MSSVFRVLSTAMMGSDLAKVAAWSSVFKQLFDSSPAQVALVNLHGVLIETNRAWKQFGRENGMAAHYDCVGMNYLQVTEPAAAINEPGAKDACVGLLSVMHAHRPKFTMVYACHSPTERRWFRMWVELQLPQVPALVVAHYLQQSRPISVDESQTAEHMTHPFEQLEAHGWPTLLDSNGNRFHFTAEVPLKHRVDEAINHLRNVGAGDHTLI